MAKPEPCIGTGTEECGRPATWIRHTQFAGDHRLCDKHAAQDPTFAKSDPTGWHHTWERIGAHKETSVAKGDKMMHAWVVTERGGRKFWSRIGVAFVNADGSLTVKLTAFPISGEFVLRDVGATEGASTS